MISYAPGLDRHVENRRQKVAEDNKKNVERIRVLNQSLTKEYWTKEITERLLQAIERCVSGVENAETTLEFISNFRFLFETCIHARLLKDEPSFKYKYRLSIYRHQLEKSKSLEKNARNSIARLESLREAENEIMKRGSFKETDVLYDDLGKEINILQELAEFHGADYHMQIIESYITENKIRESEIEEEWEAVKKEIIADPIACSLFDFKSQTSRVDKVLKDNRTWRKKAVDVGLDDMYDFIYDYTSSLLHSTSYSTLIPSALELPERLMILSLTTKVANDSLKSLVQFANIPNFQIINFDG